jgi:hypothetical protein
MKLVSAYKALGGGWQQRGEQPFVNGGNLSDMQQRSNWGKTL